MGQSPLTEKYEDFSEEQQKLLLHYVTNTDSHVFALRNLPEVIKGALFSRYSRSSLGLRSLLLKEFINNDEEAAFNAIVSRQEENPEEQLLAIRRAQNFYDRILDGYGDDSIGELGGAHMAVEHISMLAAKAIEDCRVGGSPLEKSTRYIYFDQKVHGQYLFYREPILMTSAFRDLYENTCNMLFETYSRLIPPLTAIMEERFPKGAEVSNAAYNSALRAKVLDALRGLLPASALTNMGVYGNGRFFEGLIHKLHCHSLAELQQIGQRASDELMKVIPSFVRRADEEHRTHRSYRQYHEAMREQLELLAERYAHYDPSHTDHPSVRLIQWEENAYAKVAAGLMYDHCEKPLDDLERHLAESGPEAIENILDAASSSRENRRHKSPRALERASFTFEILSDFGSYRDLQRHRILTQQRQELTCNYGYYTPEELRGTELEAEYHKTLDRAKEAYDAIAAELPEESQYIVPMAYNIRWYFQVNLRALQWLCELRSSAAGHPSYRMTAQEMAHQVAKKFPLFERFFRFVDYEGHDIGRLQQEQKSRSKRAENEE